MSAIQERIIVCGTNGTGKSTFAKKMIDAITSTNKRALAVLPDDSEPLFRSYNEILQAELKYINRVSNLENKIFFPTSRKEANVFFDDIQSNFKNGVLILDDARFYTGSLDEGLKKVFIRSRQNNVHIIFICHGLSEIPPNLITFATKIVLFNTVDSWQRLKQKIPNPNKFEKIVNEIREKANRHTTACASNRRERCNCGAAYVKKIIDIKIDLIQSNYE